MRFSGLAQEEELERRLNEFLEIDQIDSKTAMRYFYAQCIC